MPRRPAAALVQACLALLVLVALCLAPLSDGYQVIVSILLFGVILIAIAIGPWLMRSGGLRSDLFYFDMLKSMPISGRQLLFAEVAVQFSILGGVVLIAASILAFRGNGPPIGILPVFLGLVAARVTLHNLFALYFPGLVKLDPVGKENDHRFIVRGAVTVLALALLLILPLLAAGAIVTIGPAVLHVDRRLCSQILRARLLAFC